MIKYGLISGGFGLVIGIITGFVTQNPLIGLGAGVFAMIVIMIVMAIFNPNRRYLRVFSSVLGVISLLNSFVLQYIGQLVIGEDFQFTPGYLEVAILIVLGPLLYYALHLDYKFITEQNSKENKSQEVSDSTKEETEKKKDETEKDSSPVKQKKSKDKKAKIKGSKRSKINQKGKGTKSAEISDSEDSEIIQ